MSNTLHVWLKAASIDEQQALADATTSGSVNTLFQYALGNRQPSAAMAGQIEQAAALIKRRHASLPRLLRTDMAAACRECPYARKCLGQAAVASDFEPVKGGE